MNRPSPLDESHEVAQPVTKFYTLVGNRKLHKVNPREWMEQVIRNILDTIFKSVPTLYLQNFKSRV
ncbi:MAG: hypothetical protein ACQETM_11215 [Bacteroidota bacterium]